MLSIYDYRAEKAFVAYLFSHIVGLATSQCAGGEYLGFPNAVHQQDGNFFHPKNDGTDTLMTRVVYHTLERVECSYCSLVTRSVSGISGPVVPAHQAY